MTRLCAWCGKPEAEHGAPGDHGWASDPQYAALRLCPTPGVLSQFYTDRDIIKKRRATMLTPHEMFSLQHGCRLLSAAFGFHTYHVGSSLERADYRDVDLRCILDDADYDAIIGGGNVRLALLNAALSEWLAKRTGLPIDFQFQRQTDANAEFDGRRNFVGVPLSERYPEPQEPTP